MRTPYLVVFIGDNQLCFEQIEALLLKKIIELSLPEDSVLTYVNEVDKKNLYRCPVFCVYANSTVNVSSTTIDSINTIKKIGCPILPLYSKDFSSEINTILSEYNGEKKSETKVIVNHILEYFNLIKRNRRLFISYKRSDTRDFALQLYGLFESKNYNVFLDTHSIRRAVKFQEHLWHQMIDSDVVILLDSQNFLSSEWCKEELAKAQAHHIAIVRLAFPNSSINDDTVSTIDKVVIPESDVEDNVLSGTTLKHIVECVEDNRARSLASRQIRLVTDLIRKAEYYSKQVVRNDFFTLSYSSQEDGKIYYFFPAIGIPVSNDYHEIDLRWHTQLTECSQCYIIYDEADILNEWLDHLSWLDEYLRVKSVTCKNFSNWFKTH